MVEYRIISKLNPSLVLQKGTTPDIDFSRKKHLNMLIHNYHPNPELLNHVQKFGIEDIDFIVETANIQVQKETRGRKKSEIAG